MNSPSFRRLMMPPALESARSALGAARSVATIGLVCAGVMGCASAAVAKMPRESCLFNDGHFHLTNYVQQGTDAGKYVDEIMGDKVCRSTLFGIPLQQTWSHGNSGNFAPTYYLQTDAPLYYYSFTDAYIARAFQKLKPAQQARLDPMITGFNPADMYAVDHIRRSLELFPGVFSGIGEFTIHKEFVSSKVAGETASLTDPALDRILEFAGETGLVAIVHNDIDMPFAKEGTEPVYLVQMKEVLRRHPRTTIIWAHTGLGRVVHPQQSQAGSESAERSPYRTSTSTFPGTRLPSTRSPRLRRSNDCRSCSMPILIASCSAPTTWRRRRRRPRCACTTCGPRSGRS
jgi:Amidohydrolase